MSEVILSIILMCMSDSDQPVCVEQITECMDYVTMGKLSDGLFAEAMTIEEKAALPTQLKWCEEEWNK